MERLQVALTHEVALIVAVGLVGLSSLDLTRGEINYVQPKFPLRRNTVCCQ